MGERWLIHRKSIETLLIWANMESETLSEKKRWTEGDDITGEIYKPAIVTLVDKEVFF